MADAASLSASGSPAFGSPSFSIVITTYNRLMLLKRAVQSAFDQTVVCEVVVVDNASTDGTQAYVESLGRRVTYVRNSRNTNHSGAVNSGVDAANGDWIKLVDDDDYLAVDCLEEMIRAIALNPQSVICSCQAVQVNADEVELSRTPVVGPGKVCCVSQSDIHYGMLLEVMPFGTPIQVAVRRDAFLKSGGWDLSMTSCDDIDSWIRIAEYGDALFINNCLAYRTAWTGGYDRRIALRKRLKTNLLIKARIYARVDEKHRAALPMLSTVEQYLHLHWAIVALKRKQFGTAVSLGFPVAFSPKAWQLLRQAADFRKQRATAPIEKVKLA